MRISINLNIDVESAHHPHKSEFEKWINAALSHLPSGRVPTNGSSINIAIIDAKYSEHLNSEYRQKNKPTNVLSFPNTPIPGEETTSLGDLAICDSIVEQEAATQGKKSKSHWAHLTLHGFLHLLKYDHVEELAAREMEQIEIETLKELGYPNPYE